jgi:hypothetical protein
VPSLKILYGGVIRHVQSAHDFIAVACQFGSRARVRSFGFGFFSSQMRRLISELNLILSRLSFVLRFYDGLKMDNAFPMGQKTVL